MQNGFLLLTAVLSASTVLDHDLTVHAATCLEPVVYYNWRVTEIPTSFDGVALTSFGINDRPSHESAIDVTLGQQVQVTLTNELDVPTCIHWHGLKQMGTQEMDGLSDITQCRIQPNGTAVYHFTPDRAGSFWWHGHDATQYSFGLRGPLVVHAPDDQLQAWEKDVDAEFSIQLADLYHQIPDSPPIWDTILINNLGRYDCTAAAAHSFTDCTEDQPLTRFRFNYGQTYRLRVMSMSALAPFNFSIDDHEFRVIAADGDPLQPSDCINTLTINIGQRWDLLVQSKDASEAPVGPFWMRATGLNGLPWTAATGNTTDGFNANGLAIISYNDGDDAEPTTQKQNESTTVGEFDFTPLVVSVLPDIASDRAIVEFSFPGVGNLSIDGGSFTTFEFPAEPPLLAIAGGLSTDELDKATLARSINYQDHVEIVLVNEQNEQHPFHLHGHSPWVIGHGQASIDNIRNNTLSDLKREGPMLHDVYTVPPCATADDGVTCIEFGYLVLRLEADNPGVWMMHCHIDWHLDDGLAMIFIEGETQLQEAGLGAFADSILSVCGTATVSANATTASTDDSA